MCKVCVLYFSEDPPGDFPPGVFFINFLRSPLYLCVTPGVIVFRRKYTSPRGGNSEDIAVYSRIDNLNFHLGQTPKFALTLFRGP